MNAWRLAAACRGRDTNLFYPEATGPRAGAEAKRICHGCPVKPQCLEWALINVEAGVWGGTTEKERRALRKEKACQACAQAERAYRRYREAK